MCSFIVDSGSDISIIKRNKINSTNQLNFNKKFKLIGITEGTAETIAETQAVLYFNNNTKIVHNFQVVQENFPIPTDGILGRDFFL